MTGKKRIRLRKPDHRRGGLQVRICGTLIQEQGDIVCSLPHGGHTTHGTVALSSDGKQVYAFLKAPGEDVQIWQLVAAQG